MKSAAQEEEVRDFWKKAFLASMTGGATPKNAKDDADVALKTAREAGFICNEDGSYVAPTATREKSFKELHTGDLNALTGALREAMEFTIKASPGAEGWNSALTILMNSIDVAYDALYE